MVYGDTNRGLGFSAVQSGKASLKKEYLSRPEEGARKLATQHLQGTAFQAEGTACTEDLRLGICLLPQVPPEAHGWERSVQKGKGRR